MFMVLGYLFKNNGQFQSDYRVSLVKGMTTVAAADTGGWMNRRRRTRGIVTINTCICDRVVALGPPERVVTFTLHFWCLNPAVVREYYLILS